VRFVIICEFQELIRNVWGGRMNLQLGFKQTRGETISRNLFDCIAEEIDWLDAQELDKEKEELINKLKLIVDRST